MEKIYRRIKGGDYSLNTKHFKWVILFIVTSLFVILMPLVCLAEDETSLRQLFTKLDSVDNGNWYSKNNNNANSSFTWGESYVMDSYLYMYETTHDRYYLNKFVVHADGVLSWRDNLKGYKDYKGQSLPGWSTISNGKKMHFPVEGMITYPMAKFAYMVYKDSDLVSYKSTADRYIKAVKKSIKIFDNTWVDNGTTGYYIYPKGSPIWCDGIEVPFNQYLTLARSQLYMYLATNNVFYLHRVTKMAQHFKNNLTLDPTINAYKWLYWYRNGLNGWSASENRSINTPNYTGYTSAEDLSHGAIDIQFAYEAYQAGIVFNEQDMVRFGNTIEKVLTRPDATFATNVDGIGTADITSFPYGGIGNYLYLHEFAPSVYTKCYTIYSNYNFTKGGGLQAIALLNKAYAEKTGKIDFVSYSPISNKNKSYVGFFYGFLTVFIFSAAIKLISHRIN